MEQSEIIQLVIMVGTLLATFITAIALFITVRNFKKQLQLNFFADYTKRYQEIMLKLPENINEDSFDFETLEVNARDKIKKYMRAYFDLCSEEYFLWLNGNLGKKTWKEWESGIEYTFSKKAFQEGWKLVSFDTFYYADYTKYVNSILEKKENLQGE